MPVATANGKKFTFPEGTTPEQMGEAIGEYFGPSQPQQPTQPDQRGSVLNPAMRGASFGLGDEIAAGGAALVGKVLPESMGGFQPGTDIGQAYTDIRNDINADEAAFAERNPGTAVAAEVGGALLTGGTGLLKAAPTVGKGVAKVLPGKTPAIIPKSVGVGTVGTGEAALYGAATAEPGERVEGAVDAAKVSAVTSFALSPLVVKAAKTLSKKGFDRFFNKSVPPKEALAVASTKLYEDIKKLGVVVSADSYGNVLAKLKNTISKENFNPEAHPGTAFAVKAFFKRNGADMSLEDISVLRRSLFLKGQNVSPDDVRIARLVRNSLDDAVEKMTSSDVVSGNVKKASQKYGQARDLYRRMSKASDLDELIRRGSFAASGPERGISGEFRSLVKNKVNFSRYSKKEQELIEKVVKGTHTSNTFTQLGKGAFNTGQGATGNLLGGTVASGIGFSLFGPVGAVLVPLASQGMKMNANRLKLKHAKLASSLSRAGTKAEAITAAYFKAVPKKQRNAKDLTALLMNSERKGLERMLKRVQSKKDTKNGMVHEALALSLVSRSKPLPNNPQDAVAPLVDKFKDL